MRRDALPETSDGTTCSTMSHIWHCICLEIGNSIRKLQKSLDFRSFKMGSQLENSEMIKSGVVMVMLRVLARVSYIWGPSGALEASKKLGGSTVNEPAYRTDQ